MNTTSAQEAALAWASLVFDEGRFDLAWKIWDESGRLAVAQDWCHRNRGVLLSRDVRDLQLAARDLAHASPSSPLAADFFTDRLAYSRRIWSDFPGKDVRGAATSPRLAGPDLELVLLMDRSELDRDEAGFAVWLPGSWAHYWSVTVRLTHDGWRVHGPGGVVLTPGWPPIVDEVPVE